jgi:precorrin-3B synthase
MTSPAHLIKGWCPGALRPMRSGDGFVVRVRPRAGALPVTALLGIAAIAERFGSGEIDLTNRGNLQLRGITDATLDAVRSALGEMGLLDASIESEAVRNVIVDPLSGLDPQRADIRDLAAELENVLGRNHHLWELPTKFGFSLSGNAVAAVGGRNSDIMISASDDCCLICLDGAVEARCEVARGDVIDAACQLALVFTQIATQGREIGRMRDAISVLGASAIFAMAGLPVSDAVYPANDECGAAVGLLFRDDAIFAAGVGLPFGRISGKKLAELCDVARAASAASVHTGAQRVLYFPIASAAAGAAMMQRAELLGLIVRVDDVRLKMDVCPGMPGCANASTNTRADAQYFADNFGEKLDGRSLHISGCEKGCARHASASFTFVGRGGRYDVIRNGSASSTDVLETINADGIGAAIARLIAERAA